LNYAEDALTHYHALSRFCKIIKLIERGKRSVTGFWLCRRFFIRIDPRLCVLFMPRDVVCQGDHGQVWIWFGYVTGWLTDLTSCLAIKVFP